MKDEDRQEENMVLVWPYQVLSPRRRPESSVLTATGALLCLTVVLTFAWVAAAFAGSTISYRSGNETVQGYLAVPQGAGPFPALVVIHERWGLDGWIRQNADRLAQQGYLTLAVDLYRGQYTADSEEANALMRGLPDDRATRDLAGALAFLKTRPDINVNRIGAIGWGMGGGFALAMALTTPELAACVVNYGRLVTEKTSIDRIACPILGIFAEDDRGIPALSVKAFERACTEAGKSVEITLYPGMGHAFINENNKRGYDDRSARDAWDRTYAFLAKTLR